MLLRRLELGRLLLRGLLRLRLLPRRRRRLLSARLVSHRDQESCDVLAVVACLLEGRAAALRGDAISSELNGGEVRVVVGTFDASRRIRLADFEVTDDLALLVVEAAQESPSSEKTAKASIGEGRKSTGN
jgi:hypothetical protein